MKTQPLTNVNASNLPTVPDLTQEPSVTIPVTPIEVQNVASVTQVTAFLVYNGNLYSPTPLHLETTPHWECLKNTYKNKSVHKSALWIIRMMS